MDPKKISSFAQLLKDNGDKILNSGYKLTLSGSLLRALNDSFVFIVDQNEKCPPKSFQVVKTNNSKSDAIRDLQFIHDFIQKTLILSITSFQTDDAFDGIADISKFRNLQRLEIQRFYVKQITGIQQLRSQLQEIACVRKSVTSVKEIISDCGGDNSNGFVWNELKIADFSCNGLTTIDTSLEFAQFLQRLNLSHNQIVSVDAIKWLPYLKVLDLSYNKLTHIPTFNIEAGRRLQILLLSNNFIEEISGLSRLDALNELDLSGNCILDHSILYPISPLAALRYLNLAENPLAFYAKYRDSVAKFLHKNTSSVKFILDNEPLSKYEKSITGKYKSSIYQSLSSAHVLCRSNTMRSVNSLQQNSKQVTPSSSISSINSIVERDNPNLNTTHNESSTSLTNSVHQPSARRVKVRKVQIGEIGEHECNTSGTSDRTKKEKQSVESMKPLEGNKEHLEMKKDIENLVKKYGEEWLHKEGANLVHNVIGVQYNTGSKTGRFSTDELFNLTSDVDQVKTNQNIKSDTSSSSTSKLHDNNEQLDNILFSVIPENVMTTGELISSTPTNQFASEHNTSLMSGGTEYKSISVDDKESRETLNSVYKSFDDDSNDPSILDVYNLKDTSDLISDPEDDEEVYPVILDTTGEELFLTVSDTTIREKDILTNRTRSKWPIKMLESCERIKSDLIRINFDTIRKDKKQRSYHMKLDLCQKLEKFLRDDILAKRPLSEMNQTLFRCANCSAQFCKENTYKKNNLDVRCIECRSTFVVEIKESSPKLNYSEKARVDISSENAAASKSSTSIRKSASHSSIAPTTDAWRSPLKLPLSSVGSLNESSSCSKISNSESSFDSNQSVAGSSNSERDRDLDINGRDSDIEILSNPSQSSIEVLDRIYTIRKSFDERRVSQVPTLETITSDLSRTLTNQSTSTDFDHLVNTKSTDVDLIGSEELTPVQNVNPNFDLKNDKKNLLSGIANLTESSSSGSVTDSICTAYEQTQGKSVDETAVLESKGKSDKLAKNDTTISSVLNNLLQSTNILLSKTQNPSTDADDDGNNQIEPYKFSYKNFNEVDHRLKLYFYQNLFEDENENFKWLVKCKIIDENSNSSDNNNDLIFNGLLLVTTTKLYILKIINNNYDNNPKNWLKRYLSVTIDRLDRITVLPWKIGIELNIKLLERINILLLDILRTDNLLLFISTNLPDSCTIIYQQSDILLKKLLKQTDNSKIEMFAILKSCDITPNSNSSSNNNNNNNNNDSDNDSNAINLKLSSLLITDINLYLSNTFKWLLMNNTNTTPGGIDFVSKHQQDMSNLLEYKKLNSTQFILYFYDDNLDKYENWDIDFETEQCADSTLNAICQSWEKIFDVPLTSN